MSASAPQGPASTTPAAPRPEVSKAVANKPIAPAGGMQPGSSATAAHTTGGATSISAKSDKPVPAATPSPSMVGVQAAINVGSKASPPSGGSRPSGAAPRQSGAQVTGSTRLDSSTNSRLTSSVRTATPAHTIEIVSRAPTLAAQGAPPTATPLPGGMPSQGPASLLSQQGVRSAGTAIPKGPPAVAVGRASSRGTLPAVTTKGGKPATSIAKKYQIVFVSAEVAPWSKTGGLGEAMDGLPIALAALGHRVMTVTPRYDQYLEAWDTSYCSEVMMGNTPEPVRAFHAYQSKVDRVFVDHPCFLAKVWGKTGSMLYGPEWGKDYPDNQYRFSYFAKDYPDNQYRFSYFAKDYPDNQYRFSYFAKDYPDNQYRFSYFAKDYPDNQYRFSYFAKDYPDNQYRFSYFAKATLKLIKELPLGGSPYGTDTMIFVNDWHAALVPVYLDLEKKANPSLWANARTAMIIHNALFQGRFDRDDAKECSDGFLNLPQYMLKEFTFEMPLKVGKQHKKVPRCLNWMAGGAKFVDRILTVSPTYAWELLSLPEKSVELEDIFRKKGITGIINGAKETVSPQSELFVKKAKMLSQFGPSDVDEKKAELKAYLQSTYGLPVSKETALCVFLGRMDLQKGYDYLLAALEATLSTVDVQVVIVGTGRADLVAASKALAKKHPKKMYLAGWMGPERYALVAGADYMLMPSRWEPCGLAQIESMRFGTLPVVSQTGGLVDTVDDMLTGVHLSGALSDEADLDPASVEIMAKGLEKCAALTKNTAQVSKMRKAAMAAGNEYTWSNSALQYEAVCEEMGVKDVLPMCPDNLVTLEVDKVVS
eukprot:CAMPEP_0178409256 /NCGR_PEP_ID=MMETSP0689_2-20121128/20369_1 /TAXON_ID=160604 /ORGANISM="Amphidinium massartii, Strain CS-259" /LENGTH=820 /DNA_ID=CAMNT_0020030393 /DNA_START=44 /DNA_END=2506 /DNA_ORIENTATION=+